MFAMGCCFEVGHYTHGAPDCEKLTDLRRQVPKEPRELKLRFSKFSAVTAPSVTS